MKSIGNNFNRQQIQHQQMVRADMNKVDAGEARHAAQSGGSGLISKKAEEKKTTKAPTEQIKLSSAAELEQAKKQDNLAEARQDGKESVADDFALQKKGKELRGKDDDDKKVGAGTGKAKEGSRVFALDDSDDGEVYEVSKTQAKNLDKLDDRSPESILKDMPEASRNAATATLDAQIKTKGKDKVSELKDDPKVTAVVEQMDLEPAEGFKEGVKIAPIATNTKPLAPEISPNDEVLAKEAAIKQMQNGGGEQMIA